MINIKEHTVCKQATIGEALIMLNNLSDEAMTLFVLDEFDVMVGAITDGDIRRLLIRNGSLNDTVASAMNVNFVFIKDQTIDVAQIRKHRNVGITLLPLLDENCKIRKIYNLKKLKSVLPVDAVIMAGGKGTRLRPLTDKIPKPLLQIGDKAIIDHNVDSLMNYGISHINITVNYLKEQIEQHYEKERNGIKVKCIPEPRYLGTLGSIKFIDTFYNDTILVMNSDLYTNIDYEDFYLYFKETNADMAVATVPYTISIPYGIFDLDGDKVKAIKEKPSYNYYSNAGIYLIKKELLDLIPSNSFFNATEFIDLLVKEKYFVTHFPITGYWIDIGKHEDYVKAQELVKHL